MNCFLLVTLIAVLVWVVTIAIKTRNSLILQREEISAARSRVVSSIKRRNAVFAHILSVAVRYEEYEGQIIRDVLRSNQGMAGSLGTRDAATVVVNLGASYPALRASETYQSLMTQFGGLESEVQNDFSRHNDLVMKYNATLSGFPINLLLASEFQAVTYLDSSMEANLLPEGWPPKLLSSGAILRKTE